MAETGIAGEVGMKTSYSNYQSSAWTDYKRASKIKGESITAESLVAAILWSQSAMEKSGKYSQAHRYAHKWLLYLGFVYHTMKLKHFFIAPGVADFCISSVPTLQKDYFKTLPACAPVRLEGYESELVGCFAIHFPTKEHRPSILVCPKAKILAPEGGVLFNFDATEADGREYDFMVTDGFHQRFANALSEPHDLSKYSETWMVRFVLGFSLYIDAFPELCKEATMEDVYHSNHFKGEKVCVGKSEIIDEENRHSVSPHFRRGHFRLLSSERFVHKKGQTVFVKGCFVRGEAFKVESIAGAT